MVKWMRHFHAGCVKLVPFPLISAGFVPLKQFSHYFCIHLITNNIHATKQGHSVIQSEQLVRTLRYFYLFECQLR